MPLNPHQRWAARLRLVGTVVLWWLAVVGACNLAYELGGAVCR